MTMHTLANVKEKILVVGSIYDKLDKLNKIAETAPNYGKIIFNGNLLFPFDDVKIIKYRIDIMNELIQSGKIIYNLGSYDLKLLSVLNENNDHFDIQTWINSKSNVIAINFANSSSALIMSGGVTPNIKSLRMLDHNIEVSFVSYVCDKPWQIYYGGWMGYIISNSPQSDVPTFFPYAAQIGIKYSIDSPVYAKEIEQTGLKNTIKF